MHNNEKALMVAGLALGILTIELVHARSELKRIRNDQRKFLAWGKVAAKIMGHVAENHPEAILDAPEDIAIDIQFLEIVNRAKFE